MGSNTDGHIRHVTLSGSRQTAIERHLEAGGLRMTTGKDAGCTLRTHRMTGRRAFADSV